jgi:hypothetical protein
MALPKKKLGGLKMPVKGKDPMLDDSDLDAILGGEGSEAEEASESPEEEAKEQAFGGEESEEEEAQELHALPDETLIEELEARGLLVDGKLVQKKKGPKGPAAESEDPFAGEAVED